MAEAIPPSSFINERQESTDPSGWLAEDTQELRQKADRVWQMLAAISLLYLCFLQQMESCNLVPLNWSPQSLSSVFYSWKLSLMLGLWQSKAWKHALSWKVPLSPLRGQILVFVKCNRVRYVVA